MKSIIRGLVVLSGLCISFQCNADNGVKHVSKVDGVSPMSLFMSANSKPNDLFTDGDEEKLIAHCNGSNKIFVYELGSKAYICNSRFVGKSTDSDNKDYEVDVLGIEESDKNGAPKPIPDGQGIYTISIAPIPQKKWEVGSLPQRVIAQLQELSRNKYKCPEKSPCEPLIGKQYKKGLEAYEGQIESEKIDNLAIKIRSNSTDLLIAPVAIALVGDVDGGSVVYISMVFSKTGEALKVLGSFTGSLVRVGADIDQDGLPEIIVDSSVGYSGTINFFKIHPEVEALMSIKRW